MIRKRPSDWKAKKLIDWGRRNQHRIMAKPLEAQIGELNKIQGQIEELVKSIRTEKSVKFVPEKLGGNRNLYSDTLKELKAKRTFLIHEIELGKKALRVLERKGLD